jgi:Bacterial Ig domain
MKRDQQFQFKFIAVVAGALASMNCLQAQIQVPPTPGPVPPDPVAGPSVSILATDPYALEGTSSGAFTLIRTGPTTNALTVNLLISGTASNGVDYVTIPDTATIQLGFSAVDIAVQPIVDLAKRGNKTVVLSVDTNSAYTAKRWQHATVTIVDDTFNILPPTITLTSPTNGSLFGTATPIQFSADASALGDSLQFVSFYVDDFLLGRATTSPYSITWTNPVPGKFVAFARAVDQVGQSTLSAPNHFTVTNDAPTVKLTSPTNGANFVVHSPIPMTADASATAQTVAFLADGHILGTVTNPAPFTFTWTNAAAGLHVLRATATDSTGEKGYSNPVLINVSRH